MNNCLFLSFSGFLALSFTLPTSADIVVTATQATSGGQSCVRFEGGGSINTNQLSGVSGFSFNKGVQSASNFPQLNMGTDLAGNAIGYEVTGPNNFGTGSPFRLATSWTGPNVFSLRKGADPNTKIYFVTANNYVSGSSLWATIEFADTNFASLGLTENSTYEWSLGNGQKFVLETSSSLGGPKVPEPGSGLLCAIFAGGLLTRIRRR